MKNLRITNIPLVLLLALSLSGLQALGALCVAMAVPMACQVEVESVDCGDGDLQKGCCCLLDDVQTASIPVVFVAESGLGLTVLTGQNVVIESLVRQADVSLSRQAHASQQYPRLFQLHCSFLI